MASGVSSVIYPVKDLARAKARYGQLTGVQPYKDEAYYVGFRAKGPEVGLDPHGHRHGTTVYFDVDDIQASLQALLDAGAETLQEIKDVGSGKLVACVKDADGNIVGLTQPA